MLELALQTHLLAQGVITAVVGTRVRFGHIEPSGDGIPDVLYRVADQTNFETFDGAGEDLQFPIYEFECRSWLPTEAITLAGYVRRALRELRTGATITTTLGDVLIEQVSILGVDDETTRFEGSGKSRLVYSRVVVAQVGYRFETGSV